MTGDDLSDILVVTVEQAVAAPYASSRLADAGARVIKVERPEGDFARTYDASVLGESANFVWCNRGKESVRLDLKDPADNQLLDAIVARADVFIENLAPGAIERLGFGHARLRERDPRLITCSISGYGDDGPRSQSKAYDLLVLAESGLAGITGNAAGPARVGVSVCDIAAGSSAFQSILQALIGRRRTGLGRHLDISLFHAIGDWMNAPLLQYAYSGEQSAPIGLHHPTLAPYGAYPCADGDILISVQNDREWRSFCRDVLDAPQVETEPRFATNAARVANRDALGIVIAEITMPLRRAELGHLLDTARIAYGRVSTLDDLVRHPHSRYVSIDTPGGVVRMLSPGALHDGAVQVAQAVPALGENDDGIRREFGAPQLAAAND